MEHPKTQSELDASVMMHPLDSADALTIDRLRAAVRAQKGARWSIEARKPYDALLENVPAPDQVTFEPGTVGDVSGIWIHPASSRPDQVTLHFHGPSCVMHHERKMNMNARSMQTRRRILQMIATSLLAPFVAASRGEAAQTPAATTQRPRFHEPEFGTKVSAATENFGSIDLLVTNAGIFSTKPFTEFTTDDFNALVSTNLLGFLYVTQLAVEQMLKQQSGAVVSITAALADQPIAGVNAAVPMIFDLDYLHDVGARRGLNAAPLRERGLPGWRSGLSKLDMDDAAADADCDRLRPILGAQLVHDVPGVRLDRILGDQQPDADVAIAIALGDPRQHLDLARGQGLVANVLGQVLGHQCRQVRAAGVDPADHRHKFLERRAFQDIPASPGGEGPLDLDVAFGRRQHDDPRIREGPPNRGHRGDAALVGEPQIHERDVGPMRLELRDRISRRGCHGEHLHVRLVRNHGGDPLAEDRMVVDAQDADTGGFAHLNAR
jgi:hypothetical protein